MMKDEETSERPQIFLQVYQIFFFLSNDELKTIMKDVITFANFV